MTHCPIHEHILAALKNIATQLRIDSVRSTSEAGTGHPTTCLSAADIVATLFFDEMRFDPKNPHNPDNDRFVLSKGHAAPILYAAWAEAGLFPREELLKLRQIDSDLEGHPTPRLSFVDVATGSLGQGICAAIGTALNARRIGSDYRTYVLSATARWRKDRCGKPPTSRALQARQPVRHHRRQRARPEPGTRSSATTWRRSPRAGTRSAGTRIVVDGHDIPALLEGLRRSARDQRAPDDDAGANAERQGPAVDRGQGRVARQGAEEGRRNRQGDRRAREADRAGAAKPAIQAPRSKSRAGPAARLLEDAGARLQEGGLGRDARSVGHGARRARRRRSARRRARRRRQELDLQRQVRKGRARIASTRTSSPSR